MAETRLKNVKSSWLTFYSTVHVSYCAFLIAKSTYLHCSRRVHRLSKPATMGKKKGSKSMRNSNGTFGSSKKAVEQPSAVPVPVPSAPETRSQSPSPDSVNEEPEIVVFFDDPEDHDYIVDEKDLDPEDGKKVERADMEQEILDKEWKASAKSQFMWPTPGTCMASCRVISNAIPLMQRDEGGQERNCSNRRTSEASSARPKRLRRRSRTAMYHRPSSIRCRCHSYPARNRRLHLLSSMRLK
jgi:hypothetical protein